MKKSKKPWIIGGVVAAAVVLVAAMMILPGLLASQRQVSSSMMQFESVASLRGADQQLVAGAVHTAESENFYVDASKGRVSEIKVTQGSEVRKDDELYVYSNPTLTIQLEKMRIQLQAAKRKVASLETNLANINNDIKKAPSTEALDQLKEQRTQIRESLESARSEITLAELDIEESTNQVAALTVRSSFDGVVEMVNEDERNAVGQGTASKPLIRVVSNLPYEVKGSLTELQRSQLKQEMAFTATSKAIPGKKWRGTITYVSTFPTEAAAGSGGDGGGSSGQAQYEFVAKLESQENLVPGNTLFLEVNTSGNDAIRVPAQAVLTDEQGGRYVFVVENGRLKKQTVTVGEATAGEVPITSPLESQVEILMNPDGASAEGMEVLR